MVPNDIELRVYTNQEWNEILEKNDTIEGWKFPLPTYEVWKCPKCERLYVFEDGNDKAIKVYNLET
jgi:hypothetical protein